MIIKRGYVTFGKLKETDVEAGEIFDKAFNESYLTLSNEEKEVKYKKLLSQRLYDLRLDCCFDKILDVKVDFECLDAQKPYDNGFTYEDVNSVEIEYKDANNITLRLINKCGEDGQIVSVEEIEKELVVTTDNAIDVFGEIAKLYDAYIKGEQVEFSKELQDRKEYFIKTANVALSNETISTSIVQRRMAVGYSRAAKTVDLFDELGLIKRKKSRYVVLSENVNEFLKFLENN